MSRDLDAYVADMIEACARTGGPAASGQPAWAAYAGDGKAMTFVPGANGSIDARTRHHCAFGARMYPTNLQ